MLLLGVERPCLILARIDWAVGGADCRLPATTAQRRSAKQNHAAPTAPTINAKAATEMVAAASGLTAPTSRRRLGTTNGEKMMTAISAALAQSHIDGR